MLASRSVSNLRELVADWDPDSKPVKIGLKSLKKKTSVQHHAHVEGEWIEQTAGGNMSHASWRHNPQFSLRFQPKSAKTKSARIVVTMTRSKSTSPIDAPIRMGFYIAKRHGLQVSSIAFTNAELIQCCWSYSDAHWRKALSSLLPGQLCFCQSVHDSRICVLRADIGNFDALRHYSDDCEPGRVRQVYN